MKKILFIILAAASVFAGCKKSVGEAVQTGNLSLKVTSSDKGYNVVTKANDVVDDFVIEIYRYYDRYTQSYLFSEIKGSMLTLGSGDYSITAHSPEMAEAGWDLPYYSAKEDFTVVAGQVTPVNLVCELANVKVTLILSENFKKELSTYDVTVSNGKGKLTWTKSGSNDDFAADKAGYFTVAPLQVTVTGHRAIDNTNATTTMDITDVEARDHHIINIDAKVTGQIGGDTDGDGTPDGAISITIDNTVNKKDETVFVDGLEEIPVEGGEDNGGDDDTGDDDNPPVTPPVSTVPTLVWEANSTFADVELPMVAPEDVEVDVNLLINAPEGIREFLIYVNSEVLSETIGALTTGGVDSNGIATMDMINDDKLYSSLGQTLPMKDKIENQTSVPFSLSDLVPMINVYLSAINPGDRHEFRLHVVDNKGQILEQMITFVSVEAN